MSFEFPKSNWLPLSDGVLKYHHSPIFPERSPEQLINRLLERISDDYPRIEAEFSAEDSTFFLSRRHIEMSSPWTEEIGWFRIGHALVYDAGLDAAPEPEFREEAGAFISVFTSSLERVFRLQAARRTCALYGRVGSAAERRFDEIPSDVFSQFQITDWLRGNAVSENGERLFSIHVAPTEGMAGEDVPPDSAEASTQPEYKHVQFARWVRDQNVTRGTATLEMIGKRYLRETKRTIDDKTMRKAFRMIDAEQGR